MSSSRKSRGGKAKKREAAEPSYLETEIAALEAITEAGDDTGEDDPSETQPEQEKEQER
jgi:hypothetical protein